MFTQGMFVENCKYVSLAVPIDTTGAAVAGDWVSLKNHKRMAIIIQQGAWAGGTPAVTLKQATAAAGTGTKALTIARYWSGTALTDDVLAETTVSSDTFNLTATANTFTILEVHWSDLDIANGFFYVQLNIASPGANADLIWCGAILYDAHYQGKPVTLPSSIT